MFLSIITYFILLIAYLHGITYIALICGKKRRVEIYLEEFGGRKTLLLAICDAVLFRRLFRVNKLLWFGEWLFHLSFFMVVLSHLRFVFTLLPRWWSHIVCMGKYAGWVMTLSMIYILMVRALIDFKRYISPGNLLLITLIFFSGLSGLLMRYIFRVDVITIKSYMLHLFALKPVAFPHYKMFIFHYLIALTVLLYLPSHILTAPLTIKEARTRQQQLTERIS